MTTSLLVVHVDSAFDPPGRETLYRTLQPCRALGELEHVSVVSGSLLSPGLAEGALLDEADVLVIGEAAEPDLLPVVESRHRQQRLTIYEIRSHVLAPTTRVRARDLVARGMPTHLARHADGVQFATPALEARFGFLNARRAVFPSQLWEAPSAPAPRAHGAGRLVLGWSGAPVHLAELRAIAPALRAVLARHAEVDLAVLGDDGLVDALAAPGDGADDPGLPRERLVAVLPEGPDPHATFLAGVDVGLAPLRPTDLNRCRGDERYLEYAAHGALAVCADLEPYRGAARAGQTGFLYRDVGELEDVLERALAEPELRARVAAAAAAEVGASRLERPHVGDRLAFYLSVATQLGLPLAPHGADPSTRPRGAWTTGLPEPRFAGSRYAILGDDETTVLLRAGLDERRAGRLEEARRRFTEARRVSPRAYMPELLLGETEEDPALALEALERASELNPRSCLAPYLMGLHYGYAGAADEAAGALQRARAIAPSFGAPQERLGELAEAAGHVEVACQLYEEAALQNGGLALAVTRLASAAARGGHAEKAVALLERSLADDPELWLTNLAVGRVYLELRRFHQARVHLRRALDGAEDPRDVLRELAKAEVGLGDLEAARALLEEARRGTAPQGV